MAAVNGSHTSLSTLNSREGQNGQLRAGGNGLQSAGMGPAYTQQPQVNVSMSGPTNLSGLVCNVHRTTGREPHALVGATTTILGDKLYVFGGRLLRRTSPQLTNGLYELDLTRRHWTKLEPEGDIPAPRYFHSVCALGDTKLVCYGGMSPIPNQIANSPSQSSDPQPEVVVMSDIHIYDVPKRSWMKIPTADTPQGRYAHCATILPSSAMFTSAEAAASGMHHNPSSSKPNQGTLGVALDGIGGAEMVVVGGQDSSNHYIEQVSVFNLRSLKWTATNSLGRSCGAYRSVVAPLTGMPASSIGRGHEPTRLSGQDSGSAMLIYSNYNFLDVKLELQVRSSDGRLSEKAMSGQISPPGLRFPNGGVIDGHFVVSGTYLTSSKQEYALWALDLKTLTWGRIDAGGAVFGQGSWNRGILWNRRNSFVILGHRKRSLVEDYNHRRINFSHICIVELEAFGLYDNPRSYAPTSMYISNSSPSIPASLQPQLANLSGGGRPLSSAADLLGQAALSLRELADMDLVAIDGERVPVNSRILARRWGPYFVQLLKESASQNDGISDAATLRPTISSAASRNSSITITPSIRTGGSSTLTNNSGGNTSRSLAASMEVPTPSSLLPSTRPRVLYLPHTSSTIQLLVRYLYTSALPPHSSPLCTPQSLCSLLQLARPYQIDGLLEATVERLHQVLDGRNAAAVFNAAAMAAGGGRGTGNGAGMGGTLESLGETKASASTNGNLNHNDAVQRTLSAKTAGLRINTQFGTDVVNQRLHGNNQGHEKAESVSSASTATTESTNASFGYEDSDYMQNGHIRRDREEREVWTGDVSSVIGLQKRGLRGLMEGRRLRERNGPPTGGGF
ncbi:MAG: hypothetical protein Q9160_006159 [Pyrenula sp. 1 TL-2023]